MNPLTLCDTEDNMHYSGDSWSGLTIKNSFTGDPADTPPGILSARLQLRDYDDKLIYEFSTETGSENGLPVGYPYNQKGNISIIEHPSYVWILSVDSQPLPVPIGTYVWDLEIVNKLNVKNTILTGSLSVCKDITH